jgi:ketosteroid isomerase-like protein/mono/diheme cytochrome c family protein
MKKHIKHHSITVAIVLGVLALGAGAFVYSGIYNIGADDHHTKPVFAILQTLRERSIRVRSEDLKVPDLNDPQLILKGAGQYAAMCTDCHLRPGMTDSEIRPGLYPQPPNLSQTRIDPKAAFWVIKHGLKMSAMPAWGFSHDDATIWSMVAFVEKLPGMTPAEYQDIVARAPPDEDMKMPMGMATGEAAEHAHSHGDAAVPRTPPAADMAAMPAMATPAHTGHSHSEATMGFNAPISLEGLKPKAVPQAEAVSNQLHAALEKGDRNAVLALLAPDVTISEDNVVQTRDAYANGHLGEDLAFLKDAKITPVSLGSMSMGDTAMVGSESELRTTIKGKPVSLRSREMLDLKKSGNSWKIVAIHWQSTPLTEKGS